LLLEKKGITRAKVLHVSSKSRTCAATTAMALNRVHIDAGLEERVEERVEERSSRRVK
jgi:hypothetical protein